MRDRNRTGRQREKNNDGGPENDFHSCLPKTHRARDIYGVTARWLLILGAGKYIIGKQERLAVQYASHGSFGAIQRRHQHHSDVRAHPPQPPRLHRSALRRVHYLPHYCHGNFLPMTPVRYSRQIGQAGGGPRDIDVWWGWVAVSLCTACGGALSCTRTGSIISFPPTDEVAENSQPDRGRSQLVLQGRNGLLTTRRAPVLVVRTTIMTSVPFWLWAA